MFSVRGSIVVSIPACHAGNRGSIPRRGVIFFSSRSLSRSVVRHQCLQKELLVISMLCTLLTVLLDRVFRSFLFKYIF